MRYRRSLQGRGRNASARMDIGFVDVFLPRLTAGLALRYLKRTFSTSRGWKRRLFAVRFGVTFGASDLGTSNGAYWPRGGSRGGHGSRLRDRHGGPNLGRISRACMSTCCMRMFMATKRLPTLPLPLRPLLAIRNRALYAGTARVLTTKVLHTGSFSLATPAPWSLTSRMSESTAVFDLRVCTSGVPRGFGLGVRGLGAAGELALAASAGFDAA